MQKCPVELRHCCPNTPIYAGNGIYTIGINPIIKLLKDFLSEYISDYAPVTRADLNCFIQYDLSFIKKDMFSTRKRKYSTINEIGDANTTQTIYIGKEPFKLRLYNKSLELKKSKKYEVMNEYFANNDFDLEEQINKYKINKKKEND